MKKGFHASMNEACRMRLLSACAINILGVMLCQQQAFAQEASETATQEAPQVAVQGGSPVSREVSTADITVTGTRLRTNGYDAPTPTQVLGIADIKLAAPRTIDDFVNQVPSISGSMTLRSRAIQGSNGTSGISSPSLRSLGSQRTLVLLDGQRSVSVTQTGETDAGSFPQQLIQRVDVVTGGASALYGSDALAGVVNFILDKKYTGFKAELSGGITTYGDDPNYKIAATYGTKFADGRGHFLVSAEYQWNKGVGRQYRDRLAAGKRPPREWQYGAPIYVNNPAYNATTNPNVPQFISSFNGDDHAGPSGATPGGIISGVYLGTGNTVTYNSPLVGTAFTNAGTPYAFQYGVTDANRPSQYMIGGDWRRSDLSPLYTLDANFNRLSVFSRADYDVTDDINVFAQFQHFKSETIGSLATQVWIGPNAASGNNRGSLRLASDNAYLRAALANDPARLAQLSTVNSVLLGTVSEASPLGGGADREINRFSAGASGKVDLFGRSFDWNFYGLHSVAKTHEIIPGSFNVERFTQGIDAVVNPANGQIVCRSTLTNPGNGCLPINLIGYDGKLDPGVEDYVWGSPTRDNKFTQDVFSAMITGEPFDLWAGPVSMAAGIEHRREKLRGVVDELSVRGTSTLPNGSVDVAHGWSTNFLATKGQYHVTEGFLETAIPLIRDASFTRLLKIDGAVRATEYSTSGYVTTWKVGLLWEPVSGVRFRGSQSRDIRAPAMAELFTKGLLATLPVIDRSVSPAVTYPLALQFTVGNPNLKPEKADTTGFGVVLEPQFLPGFSFSADWYRIKLKDAIGTVSSQTIVDQCGLGNTTFCAAVTRENGAITQINNTWFNFASQDFRGIDFEASYRREIGNAILSLRAMATRFLKAESRDGISPPINYLGDFAVNNLTPAIGSLPKFRYRLSATYDADSYAVTLIGRGTSGGKWSNGQIECSTDCPAALPTGILRTVDNNTAPASFYLDGTLTFRPTIGSMKSEVYFNVQNIFNKDPGIAPRGTPGILSYGALPTNSNIYDTLGRIFNAGIRVEF